MLYKLNLELGREKGFLISLILASIFAYPIISSSVYYVDDLARSQVGFLGWSSLGRPLADYIFFIFSLKHKVSVDVSPLPQILSVIIMAYTISMVSERLFSLRTTISILASSIIFINPLFLQNLVYRYDSLSMVMSVSFCVFACFYSFPNKAITFIIKSVLVFASLCLYQVSSVCYAMMKILSYSLRVSRGQHLSLKEIGYDVLVVLTSYLTYFILITRNLASSRSETIFTQSDWVHLLLVNIDKFYNMYSNSFNKPVSIIVCLTVILSALIYTSRLIGNREKINGIIKRILCITLCFSPFLLVIASISTIAILKESMVAPRIATTFGVILLYASCILSVKSKTATLLYSSIVVFFSIVISFALSSSMKDQYAIDTSLVVEIKQSIESNDVLLESKTTAFGIAKESLVAKSNARVFPVVNMINNRVYDGTASIMLTRFGLENVNFSFDRKKWMNIATSVCSTTAPTVKNNSYSIYNKGGQNYVFLGKPPRICI